MRQEILEHQQQNKMLTLALQQQLALASLLSAVLFSGDLATCRSLPFVHPVAHAALTLKALRLTKLVRSGLTAHGMTLQ